MKLDIQKFASGTINGTSTSSNCSCRVVWSSTPGTSTQNYSTITATAQVYKSGSSSTTGTFKGVININDTEYSISRKLSPYHWGNWEDIGTATAIVYHNNDGTKSTNISTYFYNTGTSMAGDYSTPYPNYIQLDTIPRASSPTLNVSSATLGSTSVTITTNRQASSFTHTIQTKIGNNVIETFTSIGTSKTFTPSISNYAPYITGSPSGQLSIVTTTYSGSTQIGSAYTNTMTLVVPDNSTTKPTASIGTLSEGTTGVIPSGWNVYVQGKSKLAYTITGTAKYSATISNYASYISGEVVYSGSSVTSGVLKSAGSNTLTAQVQDSRGFWSATDTETFNVVAYSNPLISEVKAERCLSDGTLADDGTYLKYTFKGSVSPVNNGTSDLNSYGYKIQWKEHSSSTWNDIAITNNAYTINKEDIVLSGTTFSYSTTFDIRFAITDSFTTTYSSVITLGTGKDLLNFNASGTSMAIGKVSEANQNEELFEVGMNTIIESDANYPVEVKSYYGGMTHYISTQTDKEIACGVGYSGQYRGLWVNEYNKWMIGCDNNNTFINGTGQYSNIVLQNDTYNYGKYMFSSGEALGSYKHGDMSVNTNIQPGSWQLSGNEVTLTLNAGNYILIYNNNIGGATSNGLATINGAINGIRQGVTFRQSVPISGLTCNANVVVPFTATYSGNYTFSIYVYASVVINSYTASIDAIRLN